MSKENHYETTQKTEKKLLKRKKECFPGAKGASIFIHWRAIKVLSDVRVKD